jgi:hypothetical protein
MLPQYAHPTDFLPWMLITTLCCIVLLVESAALFRALFLAKRSKWQYLWLAAILDLATLSFVSSISIGKQSAYYMNFPPGVRLPPFVYYYFLRLMTQVLHSDIIQVVILLVASIIIIMIAEIVIKRTGVTPPFSVIRYPRIRRAVPGYADWPLQQQRRFL